MRITRRTSGGRGEYEISEQTTDGCSPHDIVDHRLVLDLGEGLVIDTGTELRHTQGKFRIRKRPSAEMHLHRQLVAALLMPEAVRADDAFGAGVPVMLRGRYAIEHIHLSSVELAGDAALLRIQEAEIRNATHQGEELLVGDRVQQLLRVWASRAEFPTPIPELLEDHERAIGSGGPVPLALEGIVRQMQEALSDQAVDLGISYSEHTDVLRALVDTLDRPRPVAPVLQPEEIDPEELELRRRTAKEWRRWAVRRGPESVRFRNQVRNAYDSTCIACGKRYPSTPFNRVPGVDAAHILPWRLYELDHPANGLCLCKLHHWAFDEGIVQITWHEDKYLLEVPREAEELIRPEETGFSIETFKSIAGPIPEERLPNDRAHWPSPKLLTMLQKSLGA